MLSFVPDSFYSSLCLGEAFMFCVVVVGAALWEETVMYPLWCWWAAGMPILMSTAMNLLMCLWCTCAHTSVEWIPLRSALADCFRSQCPGTEPERGLLCRWFMERLFWRSLWGSEGGAGPGEGAKPTCRFDWSAPQSDSMGSSGGWMALPSHPWRTFITCDQPGIGCGPSPRGGHHIVGICRRDGSHQKVILWKRCEPSSVNRRRRWEMGILAYKVICVSHQLQPLSQVEGRCMISFGGQCPYTHPLASYECFSPKSSPTLGIIWLFCLSHLNRTTVVSHYNFNRISLRTKEAEPFSYV